MTRVANLTIVKVLVGGSAVAIAYLGVPILADAPLRPLESRTLSLPEAILLLAVLLPLSKFATAAAVLGVYAQCVHRRPLTEFRGQNASTDFRNGCL